MTTSMLLLAALASFGGQQIDPQVRFHTVDSRGVAKSHVEVYAVGSYLEGEMVGEVGKSNARGWVQAEDNEGDYVGVAPDGSVATTHDSGRLVFGHTEYLTLQVVDEVGRPLPGIKTTLIPAVEKDELKNFGSRQFLNELPARYAKALSRTTDSGGFARFQKLPAGRRFGVIVDDGDEDIEYSGSVAVGTRTQVLLAHNREIEGRVYLGASSTPIAGADVEITVSAFSGSGAPDQVWRSTKTDKDGVYRFTKLPNCAMGVSVETETQGVVMTCVNSGTWTDHGINGRVAAEGYTFEFPTYDLPAKAKSSIDFRVEPPAIVSVKLRNPKKRDLTKHYLGIRQVVNGQLPGAKTGMQCSTALMRLAAGYGRYAVFFDGFGDSPLKILKILDVKDATPIELTLDVP